MAFALRPGSESASPALGYRIAPRSAVNDW